MINFDYGCDIRIISLGWDCLPRTFLHRMNLYNFKDKREVRMPFDGCVTPYASVCEYIKNDFDSVFEELRYDPDIGDIFTKNCQYNHERTSDCGEFKNQMKLRIKQFNQEIKENKNKANEYIIFFLQHYTYPTELIDILKRKYPSLKFKIFCNNNNRKSKKSILTDDCYYVNVKKPYRKYENLPNQIKSIEGENYEQKLLKEFLNCISEISNNKYDADKIFSNRNFDYISNEDRLI